MRCLVILLALAGVILAGQRTVVEKIVKADTVITIKVDTLRTVKYDTLKITRTFQDTSFMVKQDTTIAKPKKK